MADGKLETLSSCVNLFNLLLILTLGSTAYNGPDTNGAEVLGWICVAQVCLCYMIILAIKFGVIPCIESELQKNNSEGFSLYYSIENHKQTIKDLSLHQLELLEHLVTTKVDLREIRNVLNSRSDRPYQPNDALKGLKKKEKDAKWV